MNFKVLNLRVSTNEKLFQVLSIGYNSNINWH